MASIKDVAKRAGVSISTVSNVFNNSKYVSENLKNKVFEAANELDYMPKIDKRGGPKTHTIGVITTEIDGLFYPYVLKGICKILEPNGYSVIFISLNSVFDRFYGIKQIVNNFEHLISHQVDGIIFTSPYPINLEEAIISNVKRLLVNSGRTIPLVSVDSDYSSYGVDSVFSNSKEGAAIAMTHLIDIGCKNIAHISGPRNTRIAQELILGYKNALQSRGLEAQPMISSGDYSHRSGYMAMRELIAQDSNIDAVFVANDQMAAGAIRSLQEYNKRIPEDVKVVGYDNVFISSMLVPPLTSVHIPKVDMGLEAGRILLDRIEIGHMPKKTVQMEFKPSIVIRKSTLSQIPTEWVHEDW